ncbi:MAG: hypothetical protein M3O01_07300 [Pseudomonadota bacterium]|nr:hypothetical protein [Pseudomonadota bacterium]
MKNLPLVQRWRESPAGVVVPAESRRLFRFWMTGSLAVVMAALTPLRGVSDAERSQTMRLLKHSRYDVTETLQRIEVAARDRGLSVLARLAGSQPVLVLAPSVGGTLVVMSGADSRLAVPFGLMVNASSDGGADVLTMAASPTSTGTTADWSELPPSVVDDLDALPAMVERALG